MTKQEDLVKKIFEPTVYNAIRDMKMAKLICLTMGDKFYSSIAAEYMQAKEKFLPFIIKEKREKFMEEYSQVFQEVGIKDDSEIENTLVNWEYSGYIMMLLNADTDWNSVDKLLCSQNHNKETINCLISKVLEYSPYGLDFVKYIQEQRKNRIF